MADEMPLRKISDAFKDLAATVNSETSDIEVAPFSRACSLVSPLFGCLGIAFKFAEMDYVSKVNDLSKASKSIATLQALLDHDMEANCVRNAGSHSRNLLRVKRGLDMVRILFEQILVSEVKGLLWSVCGQRFGGPFGGLKCEGLFLTNLVLDVECLGSRCDVSLSLAHLVGLGNAFLVEGGNSLKDPASKAYGQVFAPHHGWAIRKAVAAGMYALPTKSQLLRKLNEDDASARIQMQNYIAASAPVILYVDKLFHSRNLGIDW
ncbi:hypothetical protein TIFTF001_023744 [Ficus carica]|uniref:Glycolipid transfer protein domain-containing protein n=1 Tax=Ficus carica TaxID=3494 RepID=A0AA88DFJ1_FICCA|nr:hypothetical protein TIFTF001_023744 [Ficus carica]